MMFYRIKIEFIFYLDWCQVFVLSLLIYVDKATNDGGDNGNANRDDDNNRFNNSALFI